MLLIHTVKSTEINLYYFYFADDELLKRLFIIHYLPILRALVLMEFLNFSKCRRMPSRIRTAPGVAFKTNLPQHLSAQQDEDDEWGYGDEYEDEDHAKDRSLVTMAM